MSEIDVLLARIVKLEQKVKRLQNNSAPTIPIYDHTNFPQDAVNGQIALSGDGTAWQYINDAWSAFGGVTGGITVEWMQYSFDTGQTILAFPSPNTAQLDWLESAIFPPFMSGQTPGLMDMTMSGEQHPRLSVPGLYFFDLHVVCEGAMTAGKTFAWEFGVYSNFGGSPLDHVTYSVGSSNFASGGIDASGYGAYVNIQAMAIAPAYVVTSPHWVGMTVANYDTVTRTFWIDRAQVFRITPAITIG